MRTIVLCNLEAGVIDSGAENPSSEVLTESQVAPFQDKASELVGGEVSTLKIFF